MLREHRRLTTPARRSALLAGLFRAGVAAAEIRGDADARLLAPAEAVAAARFGAARRSQFAAGRLCARLALRDLGVRDAAVPMNADRTPRWPAGTVGSISHTTGFAGAVAATTHRMRSIGIDIEIVGRVTTEIEPRIFTGRESAFLASLSAIARDRAATAIFSAKEAFYKCQYPLTGAWLDFSAVWLELNPDDATSEMSSGTFTVDATQVAPDLPGVPLPLTGRFAIADGFALTGVALDRAHPVTTPVGASPIP